MKTFVRSVRTYLSTQHYMACRRLSGTDGLPTTPVVNRVKLRLQHFPKSSGKIRTRTAAHRSLSLKPLFVLGSRGFRDHVYNNCQVLCLYNNLFPLSFSLCLILNAHVAGNFLSSLVCSLIFSSCSNCLLSVLSCSCAMWEIPPRLLGRGWGFVRWVFEPQLWDLYTVQLLLSSVCLFVCLSD